ncbi:MAG TPA: SDR family oxidoreductase [Candidatus Sulfotelmatobacter sp.]|jgi:NAD(P)-dependent dehydrogenase (short-subunit alcohol dehydrogenase family)|nr:SDR family oxidoreductase [Candidatus Sulfotelmatobacter sp.]
MESKQVILITGASTGFGRLFAETLARHGHSVFATMRDPQGKNAKNAAELLALASRESLSIFTLECDVTSDASVELAVRSVIAQSGRIDVAINNAGYAMIGLAEAVTTQQAQQIMDTNFMGCARVNRAVLPHMRRHRKGLLMHISSGAGRVVIPAFSFYTASKFAMEALAETYRYELASQGIESVIVEPGAYQTPVFGNMVTASDQSRAETYGIANQIPTKMNALLTGAAGSAQEVADAVLRIIETPVGQKKLRYRVSQSDLGVDEINATTERVQARLFEMFRLTAETTFVQRDAAGAD